MGAVAIADACLRTIKTYFFAGLRAQALLLQEVLRAEGPDPQPGSEGKGSAGLDLQTQCGNGKRQRVKFPGQGPAGSDPRPADRMGSGPRGPRPAEEG